MNTVYCWNAGNCVGIFEVVLMGIAVGGICQGWKLLNQCGTALVGSQTWLAHKGVLKAVEYE